MGSALLSVEYDEGIRQSRFSLKPKVASNELSLGFLEKIASTPTVALVVMDAVFLMQPTLGLTPVFPFVARFSSAKICENPQ